ncbi:undecaprenyl pyrophosphate synthase [Candidatus Methylobacter favarea]|uniref:Ditrans,polycis-undecaprenyl-diphosphate synthase ((2E,6E)-farnesyl-diphosphate specific) n=1 Tax=Candidatus Methylobacter favarea TaxID=2707345 RepID=A0A8S0WAF1_9GAMM|nr:isoprenyl transferase [Candidatus Methylobacter favarea]CAA9890689.1 undecaprenyl pyrophosphate synthase [Candidatus Methylobacter favarea]
MSADDSNKDNNNPRHIAIIMDGNGRWAQKRHMPRTIGHQAGVKAVRKIVEHCARQEIEVLTLFAFSSENWRRPEDEVSTLMSLFMATLQREVSKLHRNGIRLRFIGDRAAFSDNLQDKIAEGEALTCENKGLTLVVAANYGGRWDICQALRKVAEKMLAGELKNYEIDEKLITQYLSIADLPEPDLFIRTGGEQRVSNFLLWQLAYAELYFTATLWPDFDQNSLDEAIKSFKSRQRRFGYTGEQVLGKSITL